MSMSYIYTRLPIRYTVVLNRADQGGAALVELMVVLVLFMVPLLLGVIEAGRLIYTYKTLVIQTHHAARYLSVQAPGINYATAECLFKTGILQASCPTTPPLLPGFSDPTFQLTIQETTNIPVGVAPYSSSVNVVTITANHYPYTFTFSDLFGLPSLAIKTVSVTYRQAN